MDHPSPEPLPFGTSSPVGRTQSTMKGWAVFLWEAVRHPRSIGAFLPSSPMLARRIAALADPDPDTLIVELGPGTGVVTEALLARGVAPERLVAIERSEPLARHLKERFPGIRVVCGDAADLRSLLAETTEACARMNIVSSLPLRSLPVDKVRSIVSEISAVLRSGGHWVQFTYALARQEVPRGFYRLGCSLVWQNIPPARIDVYAAAK